MEPSPQPLKKFPTFPTFYKTHRLISVFTGAATSLYSEQMIRSILILSSHLQLGLPTHLFPSGFPTKTLYAFHFFSMHAACPALDLIKKR
jgi:hypothetical protein